MVPAREEHVRRLDVAVQHPARVGGIERGTDLLHDAPGPKRIESAFSCDQRAQVGALHETHHDVEHSVLFARVEHRDHVRMVDRRGDP